MFNNLKKALYFSKTDLLFRKGLEDGWIVPFDEAFYEGMSHTYISCIPAFMHIKYLRPSSWDEGHCYDKSLYVFFCFDDALFVRGDSKDLELRFGKEHSNHYWVEIGDYVYDPSLLLRFEKDVYYKMYCPTNVHKYSKDDYKGYCETNKKFYEDIVNTKLSDFQPNGRKRADLCVIIPLLEEIANISNDPELKKDVYDYLSSIQYDERQVFEELNMSLRNSVKENVKKG